jgi:hypothetical protein
MSGVVEGGWGYVVGAYAASAIILFGYAYSVIRRYRRERSRHAAGFKS